jgi:hypothetical protein
LYRISILRTSHADLMNRLAKHEAEIQGAIAARNAKELHRLLFDGILIIKKILDDTRHNTTQGTSLSTYPNFVNDKPVYTMMAGDRPSRNAIAKLKVIISKDMHNDIVQCKTIFAAYGKDIRSLFRPAPIDPTKYGEIYTAFGPLAQLVQTGGGRPEIERALLGLRQFEVTPVSFPQYQDAAAAPSQAVLDLPTPAILGSYYRDEKGFPYSVLDPYLVTKETLTTFDALFKHVYESSGRDITDDEMAFVTTRFLLLWCDLLQSAYETLVLNDDDEVNEETGQSVESDVKFSEHKRVYYQTAYILQL